MRAARHQLAQVCITRCDMFQHLLHHCGSCQVERLGFYFLLQEFTPKELKADAATAVGRAAAKDE